VEKLPNNSISFMPCVSYYQSGYKLKPEDVETLPDVWGDILRAQKILFAPMHNALSFFYTLDNISFPDRATRDASYFLALTLARKTFRNLLMQFIPTMALRLSSSLVCLVDSGELSLNNFQTMGASFRFGGVNELLELRARTACNRLGGVGFDETTNEQSAYFRKITNSILQTFVDMESGCLKFVNYVHLSENDLACIPLTCFNALRLESVEEAQVEVRTMDYFCRFIKELNFYLPVHIIHVNLWGSENENWGGGPLCIIPFSDPNQVSTAQMDALERQTSGSMRAQETARNTYWLSRQMQENIRGWRRQSFPSFLSHRNLALLPALDTITTHTPIDALAGLDLRASEATFIFAGPPAIRVP
jgi:hypothetical protein